METATANGAEAQPAVGAAAGPKRGRRGRQQTEETVRYFLAKEGSSPEKPELGVEAANEGEALIKAFQSKNGTRRYFHHLVDRGKRPLHTVSHTNAGGLASGPPPQQ